MEFIERDISWLKRNLNNITFIKLCKTCDRYFGQPRQKGTSHRVYKTPWKGDPRINIQEEKGKAKTYQVRQVIKALERLEIENGDKNSD